MVREVLVTGATGAQGSAVVDALLRGHVAVRALVRDAESPKALDLKSRGATLAVGDFEDRDSLVSAAAGVDGVFSVQVPPGPRDEHKEIRAARHLVEAASSQGVRVFVHTSVARADDHESFVGWDEGRWWPTYWTSKSEVNSLVRSAGFSRWSILKPAFMMDNLIPPKVAMMFPRLASGVLSSVMAPQTRLDLVSARDIGTVAGAAFIHPDRFHGRDIPLAGDSLTLSEIAHAVSSVTGKQVRASSVDLQDVRSAGIHPAIARSQDWLNHEGYRVDLHASAAEVDGRMDTLLGWARDHRQQFDISPPDA